MIKNVFKIDYQLKRDEQGRQMLFVSSYQNNIKIEEHFVGYIDDILSKNKKQKEVIDKTIAFINREIEIIKEQPSKNKEIDEYVLRRYECLLEALNEVE